MTRAERRHRLERKKARVRSYWVCAWVERVADEFGRGDRRAPDNAEQIVKRAARIYGKAARTPQACSCWVCGNQRKYQGLKRQERQ